MSRVKSAILELNREAIEYLKSINSKHELYRYGKTCKNNHKFKDFDYSIRLKSNNHCVECLRENRKTEKRKEYFENYKKSEKYKQSQQKHEKSHKRLKWKKDYKEKNINNFILYNRKRRAIKSKATVHTITTKDIQKLLKFFNHSCAYCNVSIKSGYHLDHVKPLSKKGIHAIWNLVPACGKCNCYKHTSNMKIWYRQQTFYSPERLARIEKWCKMQLINYQFEQNKISEIKTNV